MSPSSGLFPTSEVFYARLEAGPAFASQGAAINKDALLDQALVRLL